MPESPLPLAAECVPLLVHLERTTSTNDVLPALWRERGGALPDLATVVADEQTRGRGRLGRRWYARAGVSLLATSLITLPDDDAHRRALPWLTLAAALALRGAAEHALAGSLTPLLGSAGKTQRSQGRSPL